MAYKNLLLQLNHDLKVVNMFNSVDEAARHLGICRSLIYGVLSGRNAWTHGFTFLWKSDYDRAIKDQDEKVEEEEAIDITEDSDEFYVLIKFKSGVMVKIPSKYIDYTVTPSQLEIEI